MPKRKRGNDVVAVAPPRKSARIKAKSLWSSPNVGIQKQDREIREKRAATVDLISKDHRQVSLLNGGNKNPSNKTSHQIDPAKPQGRPLGSTACRKRKYEEESTQPRTRIGQGDLVEPRSKHIEQQLKESAPEPSPHISNRLVGSQKDFGGSEEKEGNKRVDPISHWATYSTWPDSFLDSVRMTSTGSSGKRARRLSSQSGRDEKPRSYSQSRKDGDVPEQYTPEYEKFLFTKGVDMDLLKGEDLVSEDSKQWCDGLMKITRNSIKPTVFPQEDLRKVINLLGTRNEAIVSRDITAMILPPLTSLYFMGERHLEHVIDEVRANWHDQCILAGPRIQPDLAIGLFSSSFTEMEMDKLKRYTSVDNWTQFTTHMYFPFLMCEVKCGREGLNMADRQNMHSCSVAVRAFLRIEQEADRYRPEGRLKKLSGQVLVFSISHDQQDVRLYGHYALVGEAKWTYHRYRIATFNILTSQKDLVALYNFVQNVLKSYVSELVQRLKEALSALPEPDEYPPTPQERDADGFVVPALPSSSLGREMAKNTAQTDELLGKISRLMEQLDEERGTHEKERAQLRQDSINREKAMERQMEEQKKQMEEQRKQMEEQRKQMEEQQKEIISLLKSRI